MSDDCPTPYKMPFVSRRAAITSVSKGGGKQKMKGQLKPYRCACGSWHLTTMSKHTARKVKTSIRITKGSNGGRPQV